MICQDCGAEMEPIPEVGFLCLHAGEHATLTRTEPAPPGVAMDYQVENPVTAILVIRRHADNNVHMEASGVPAGVALDTLERAVKVLRAAVDAMRANAVAYQARAHLIDAAQRRLN